jgi:trimethylamine:corrinoid methyltransferase-like protein
MYRLLNEQAIEVLRQGTLQVLEDIGLQVDQRELLQALQRLGAVVDFEHKTVRFPRSLTEAFIAAVRAEDKSDWARRVVGMGENVKTAMSGWVPYEKSSEFQAPYLPHLFHQLATYYHDDQLQQKRKGNREDYLRLIQFGDMLDPGAGSGHSLILTEVPAPLEPLEAALMQLEYSHYPRGVYVHDVRQIEYLQEIEAIFGLTDPCWHWLANICPNSPLKLDRGVAERMLYMIKSGVYPAKLACMPVAGVNMPVTTGGGAVIMAAEFLAVWMACRAVVPDVPLTGLVVCGTMDMSHGEVSFSALDALRRRLATAEFLTRWTGIEVSPSVGEWSSAAAPGLYAALEKAYVTMIVAAFTGYHPEIGMGHLESGLSISPVQLLIDREITAALGLLETPLIDEASLGLETIAEIGFGGDRNYLDTDHTCSYLRQEVWMPPFFGRNGWTPAEEEAIRQRGLRKVEELVAAHEKPTGREEQLAAARAVVERARRELVG